MQAQGHTAINWQCQVYNPNLQTDPNALLNSITPVIASMLTMLTFRMFLFLFLFKNTYFY